MQRNHSLLIACSFIALSACTTADVTSSTGTTDVDSPDATSGDTVVEVPDVAEADVAGQDAPDVATPPSVCSVCSSAEECPSGGACDLAPGAAIGRCLVACDSEACPTGLTCTLGQCIPDDGCPCEAATVGLVERCGDGSTSAACTPTRVCVPSGWSECKVADVGTEVCNGQDDDCDGETDEGFEVGALCDGDDTDACKDGSIVCDATGAAVCSDELEPILEICNGVDDDCDGETDEDVPSGAVCDGEDEDACPDGVFLCDGAGNLACSDDLASIKETCNLADEDCDGETDEGFAVSGPCDGDDDDECPDGTLLCDGTGGAICVDDAAVAVEVCNGVDDDCNGTTDDIAVPLACDGGDEDKCPEGVETCVGGTIGCTDDSAEEDAETCNFVDDDCDGETDEELGKGEPCDGDDPDSCPSGEGVCDSKGGLVCTDDSASTSETCNGIDDDCDSLTDDGFELSLACDGPDADSCASGHRVCTADGQSATCEETGQGQVELCNGLDDDCDGLVDEAFIGLDEPCDGPDDDACSSGVLICTLGGGVKCTDDPGAAVELCNQLDDDCDGVADEDFAQLGAACDGPDDDRCTGGSLVCDGFGVVCKDDAGTKPELCNDLDDDCDGATDEDFAFKGLACDGPDSDACIEGTFGCAAGALVCSDATADQVEVCNGYDDDCDLLADESYPNKGKACDGPLDADVCLDGIFRCDGGVEGCADDAASLATEICNGADDDCDGTIDNGYDAGDPCDGDDEDECEDGVMECTAAGTGTKCNDSPEPAAELCNTLDDDCDGTTDEYYFVGLPCDGPDADQCAEGIRKCDAADPTRAGCVEVNDSAVEVCNGVDDDCNGVTDDPFALSLGVACDSTADPDLCEDGVYVCNPDGTGTECNESGVGQRVEVCNGVDDDCDNATDESAADVGVACDGPGGDSCLNGLTACKDGKLGCRETVQIAEIFCNGIDDNCDGIPDVAGTPASPTACDGPDLDACPDGFLDCNLATGPTCTDSAATNLEICNGVDDDCDGTTDVGDVNGRPCDGADQDLCQYGVTTCTNGVPGCTDKPIDQVEVCNGFDDDCDGLTDEVPAVKTSCDSAADFDTCTDDTTVCINGAPACDDAGPVLVETCDGIDNPCVKASEEEACDCVRYYAPIGVILACRASVSSSTADAACKVAIPAGRLGTLRNAPWYDGIVAFAAAVAGGSGSNYWLGLSDLVVEGSFFWTDGKLLQSTEARWGLGEPNNNGGLEDCSELLSKATGSFAAGTWNDVNCNASRPFLCSVVNRCETNPCGPNSTACDPSTNSSGYVCSCKTGYEFLGNSCTAIDACAKAPCSVNATCTNIGPGTHTCTCNFGFEGNGLSCTTMNMCKQNPCHANAACTHTGPGTYSCACKAGYSGNGVQCTEIDPCAQPGYCDPNATCKKSGPGVGTCACKSGYFGDGKVCSPVGPCSPTPCSVNATCTITGPTAFVCQCKKGYSGNGQACSPIDACAQSPCSPNAACTSTGPGTYGCACIAGYSGDGKSCAEIDGCATTPPPCSADATCSKAGPGSYSCKCHPAFQGDGKNCTPISP